MDYPWFKFSLNIHLVLSLITHKNNPSSQSGGSALYHQLMPQKYNRIPISLFFLLLFLGTICSRSDKEIAPWTNKFRAEVSEAFGLNIARGRRFDSPILGTHVPTGIAQIGSWSIGNELEQFLKYLQIPEKLIW